MSDAAEEFVVFFELLPHVLRDGALRRRIAELYKWYWDAKLEWLGFGESVDAPADADLRGLSQVLSAVIDGLALQAAIDPDMDLSVPYRVFAAMLAGAFALPNGAADAAGVTARVRLRDGRRPPRLRRAGRRSRRAPGTVSRFDRSPAWTRVRAAPAGPPDGGGRRLAEAVRVELAARDRVEVVRRDVRLQHLFDTCRRHLREIAAPLAGPGLERGAVHERGSERVARVPARVRLTERRAARPDAAMTSRASASSSTAMPRRATRRAPMSSSSMTNLTGE